MTNPLLYKVIKFATVGFLSFILDMIVTYTGKEKFKLNQYVANTISFFFAASFNFALNRLWTFQSNDNHVDTQAIKFFASGFSMKPSRTALLADLVNAAT